MPLYPSLSDGSKTAAALLGHRKGLTEAAVKRATPIEESEFPSPAPVLTEAEKQAKAKKESDAKNAARPIDESVSPASRLVGTMLRNKPIMEHAPAPSAKK